MSIASGPAGVTPVRSSCSGYVEDFGRYPGCTSGSRVCAAASLASNAPSCSRSWGSRGASKVDSCSWPTSRIWPSICSPWSVRTRSWLRRSVDRRWRTTSPRVSSESRIATTRLGAAPSRRARSRWLRPLCRDRIRSTPVSLGVSPRGRSRAANRAVARAPTWASRNDVGRCAGTPPLYLA